MNERDERLRELLRAADPAQEVPELGEGEAAWMRQRVLRAAEEQPARRRTAGAWVLAGTLAVLAIAIGLVLLRTTPPASPAAQQGASLQADTTPSERTSPARTGGNPRVATHSSRADTVVSRPSPAPPNDAAPAAALASRGDDGVDARASRVGPRTTNPTRRRPLTDVTAEATPREAVIAQARVERQPYQLQLTAPGGTRIVWVLTADNGR